MDKIHNQLDPDELLQQAARIALELIPKTEKRLSELRMEMDVCLKQLGKLKALASLADVGGAFSPPPTAANTVTRALFALQARERLKVKPDEAVQGQPDQLEGSSEPASEGDSDKEVGAQALVADALFMTAEPLTVPEIKMAIFKRSGRSIAASTIYAYLGKGKTGGLYINENNKWAMTEQGRLDHL